MGRKILLFKGLFRVPLLTLAAMFIFIPASQAGSESFQVPLLLASNDDYSDEDRDRKKRHEDREEEHEDDDPDRPDHTPPPTGDGVNYIALHDSSSDQFNDNCSGCHANIHTRQTLDPSIPDAHVVMLPLVPGESNDRCIWCHRSVDLVLAAGSPKDHLSSLRKHIDSRVCALCHGPGGVGKQFYQANFSNLQLNGTEMYGLLCSACHGRLTESEVKGEDAGEIQEAINEDEGGMNPLKVLTTQQIQEIADALRN